MSFSAGETGSASPGSFMALDLGRHRDSRPRSRQSLRGAGETIAQQNLSFAAETVRLQRPFEAAEFPALALKGVALAQLAYGSLRSKHARDIDLLVPPDRAEAAMQLLEREGYALSSPAEQLSDEQRRALVRYGREVELRPSGRKLRLELQWRAADNPLTAQGRRCRFAGAKRGAVRRRQRPHFGARTICSPICAFTAPSTPGRG